MQVFYNTTYNKTSEEEDIVYCLLGILDVIMPVAYGEGKETAWKRLSVELESNNQTPYSIPMSRNDLFVGMEQELARLEAVLLERG